MERDINDVTRQTILRKYAETRADRPPDITIDEELFISVQR